MKKFYEEITMQIFNVAVDVITTSNNSPDSPFDPGDDLPAVPMFLTM